MTFSNLLFRIFEKVPKYLQGEKWAKLQIPKENVCILVHSTCNTSPSDMVCEGKWWKAAAVLQVSASSPQTCLSATSSRRLSSHVNRERTFLAPGRKELAAEKIWRRQRSKGWRLDRGICRKPPREAKSERGTDLNTWSIGTGALWSETAVSWRTELAPLWEAAVGHLLRNVSAREWPWED